MKKKFISVIALSSIMGIGVTALASCSPKEVIKEVEKEVIKEVEVEKPVNYYGVTLTSNNDVKLTSETTNAKAGDKVRVEVELLNPSFGVAGLNITGNIQATKVEGEKLVYEFLMPETSVIVSAILQTKSFNITIDDDDTKGTFKIVNVSNREVTSAKPGTELLAIYTAVDINYMPLMVKANDEELTFNEELNGYSFHMPAKDLVFKVTYAVAAFDLYVDSPFVWTSFENSFSDEDSLIYSLTSGGEPLKEDVVNEGFDNPHNRYNYNNFLDIKPGSEITITALPETLKLENRKELKKVLINETEINFSLNKDTGLYTFDTFIMPSKDSILKFRFDETPIHTISYVAPKDISFIASDPFGDVSYTNPTEVKDGTMFKITAKGSSLYEINEKTSGIYDLKTNKRLYTFSKESSGEYSAFVRSINGPVIIKFEGDYLLEKKCLTGNFHALEGISSQYDKYNSLTINGDATYTFFTAQSPLNAITGTLKFDGSDLIPTDENVDLRITPVYEETSLKTLFVRYKKAGTNSIQYFAFTKETYSTVTNKVTLENANIAQVTVVGGNYSSWVMTDDEHIEQITLKNFEESFNEETIYELTSSKGTFNVKYVSKTNSLIKAGPEAGSYSNGYVLDGFGAYTKGQEVGKYYYDDLLNSITFDTNETLYSINIETKVIKEFVATDTILTGKSYTFDISGVLTKPVKMSFGDNKTFSFDSASQGETITGVSYLVEENTLTLRLKRVESKTVYDAKFLINPTTLELTGVEGHIGTTNDIVGKKFGLTSLNATFASKDGKGDDLVLNNDLTYTLNTASGSYELHSDETSTFLILESKKYILDFANLTYEAKELPPFFIGKTFKATHITDFSDMGGFIYTNNVTLTFKDASTFDLTMDQNETDNMYFSNDISHETKGGSYTFDSANNLITLTFSNGKNLKIIVDIAKQTIKIKDMSVKLAEGDFNFDQDLIMK